MFYRFHYLFEMHTMKRFEDPTLIAILRKMRQQGGAKLSEAEWQALVDTELDTEKLEREPKNSPRNHRMVRILLFVVRRVHGMLHARDDLGTATRTNLALLPGG